jgi:hypothetical protein
MLADRSAISIANSETGQASGVRRGVARGGSTPAELGVSPVRSPHHPMLPGSPVGTSAADPTQQDEPRYPRLAMQQFRAGPGLGAGNQPTPDLSHGHRRGHSVCHRQAGEANCLRWRLPATEQVVIDRHTNRQYGHSRQRHRCSGEPSSRGSQVLTGPFGQGGVGNRASRSICWNGHRSGAVRTEEALEIAKSSLTGKAGKRRNSQGLARASTGQRAVVH